MADLGKLWTPVVKGGTYPTGYFRTSGVARSSKRVEAVNDELSDAAKGCEGKPLKDFNQCVKDKMKGYDAPGEDAESYEYAQEHR